MLMVNRAKANIKHFIKQDSLLFNLIHYSICPTVRSHFLHRQKNLLMVVTYVIMIKDRERDKSHRIQDVLLLHKNYVSASVEFVEIVRV